MHEFHAPFLVFGNPIQHSKSPLIHSLFAAQTNIDHHYDKHLVAFDSFEQTVKAFFNTVGQGANVTVPFKEQAFEFADDLTPNAKMAGAVNTLIKTQTGQIIGDNTDGIGLLTDLKERGWVQPRNRVLLMGAGGAAKGAILPLLEAGFEVTIYNRTFDKASRLVDQFSEYFGKDSATGRLRTARLEFLATENIPYALIINATSASIAGEIPAIPLACFDSDTAIYDMFYGQNQTAFLAWFEEQGCHQRADGLGMLIYQAAFAFQRWHGVMPDAKAALSEVRKQLFAG